TLSQILGQELWLFPGCEVPALAVLLEVHQFRIGALRPAPWSGIEFVREHAYGNRDRDAFRAEIRPFAPILPIESSARKGGVRQPRDRDVVQDVIAREALGLSLEDACDQLVAASVVIKEIGGQADR